MSISKKQHTFTWQKRFSASSKSLRAARAWERCQNMLNEMYGVIVMKIPDVKD